MPELPEVESARQVLEKTSLGKRIVDVDDGDAFVCRPHLAGEIRGALTGRRLSAVHRRGKSMWCDTSGVGRSRTPGPVLGIHLGMSGKLVYGDGSGNEVDGGDYWERGRKAGDLRFSRFALRFDDGAYLVLVDPRRLGRVRLDPPVEALGPDRVALRGVRGHARPSHYKVNVCHEGGWLAEGEISYAGPRAEARARLAADVLRQRLDGLALRVDLIGALSILGDDAGHALAATADSGLRDIRLRVAATHAERAQAERLGREVMALYTCGPAGGGGVRTTLTPRLNTLSCLLPREAVPVGFEMLEEPAQ